MNFPDSSLWPWLKSQSSTLLRAPLCVCVCMCLKARNNNMPTVHRTILERTTVCLWYIRIHFCLCASYSDVGDKGMWEVNWDCMHGFTITRPFSQFYHLPQMRQKRERDSVCVCMCVCVCVWERAREREREKELTHWTHSVVARGFSFMLYSARSKGILTAPMLNNVHLLLVTGSFINMNSNTICSFLNLFLLFNYLTWTHFYSDEFSFISCNFSYKNELWVFTLLFKS